MRNIVCLLSASAIIGCVQLEATTDAPGVCQSIAFEFQSPLPAYGNREKLITLAPNPLVITATTSFDASYGSNIPGSPSFSVELVSASVSGSLSFVRSIQLLLDGSIIASATPTSNHVELGVSSDDISQQLGGVTTINLAFVVDPLAVPPDDWSVVADACMSFSVSYDNTIIPKL